MPSADNPDDRRLQRGPRGTGNALPYTGRPGPGAATVALPRPVRRALDIPSLYRPDDGLIAAANVALTLRLPLLLSGRPGTGKTEMARSLALTLHGERAEDRLYPVHVTSGSNKSDMLYSFDELGRLRAAYEARDQPTKRREEREFLQLRGLGAAIVAAGHPADPLEPIVPGRALPAGLNMLADLIGEAVPGPSDARAAAFLPEGAPPPVVLIDEIDKAPRELPNDLLTELDRMQFAIPELGVRVRLHDEARWPVVVITSNAERPLSEAFLRRCVCYEVEIPGRDTLLEIIESKLAALRLLEGASALPAEVVGFVEDLGHSRALADGERPGIARVLDFAVLLADPARLGYGSLRSIGEGSLRACLTALLPSRAAQDAALTLWREWAAGKTPSVSPRR